MTKQLIMEVMEKVIIQENKSYMHIYSRQNSFLHEKKYVLHSSV